MVLSKNAIILGLVALLVVFILLCTIYFFKKAPVTLPIDKSIGRPVGKPMQMIETPRGAEQLVKAYPDHLAGIADNKIVWKDGSSMPYGDGKHAKSFEELLNAPSLWDQMSMPYTKGATFPKKKDWDPGRIRYQPFFEKMYGSTEAEVRARLKSISWLPKSANKSLLVTSINGVDKKLQAISNEIEALPQSIKRYASNNVSTFKWRPIEGTGRLSAHSFGIAIDLNFDGARYWLWDKRDGPRHGGQAHKLPQEIVDIFEKHGFIWGGKWDHYDTMHFEYRPEVFEIS